MTDLSAPISTSPVSTSPVSASSVSASPVSTSPDLSNTTKGKNDDCWVVAKFGGTSLATADRFITAANIIHSKVGDGKRVAAVLSAPGNITDKLFTAANVASDKFSDDCIQEVIIDIIVLQKELHKLLPKFDVQVAKQMTFQAFSKITRLIKASRVLGFCPSQTQAMIVSEGERQAVEMMKLVLELECPYQVYRIDATKHIKCTDDSEYLNGVVELQTSIDSFIKLPIPHRCIAVMPGYIGSNSNGELVTLGRNGSDYSAAILSVCIDASICEIWTDVDGLYNADPRLVDDATLLETLTYSEAMELSHFGASVLHPKTIRPLARYRIPCAVKNTLKPLDQGTIVSAKTVESVTTVCKVPLDDSASDTGVIKGLSILENLTMVNVCGPGMKGMVGIATRVFGCMAAAGISIVLIAQSSSEYSIDFCLDHLSKDKAICALNDTFNLELMAGILEPVKYIDNVSIVSLVGEGTTISKGILAKFFSALAQSNINVKAVAQGAYNVSVSAVVEAEKANLALKCCHSEFFRRPTISCVLLGLGDMTDKLLKVFSQYNELSSNDGSVNTLNNIQVVGVVDNGKMLLCCKGLPLDFEKLKKLIDMSSQDFNASSMCEFFSENFIRHAIVIETVPDILSSISFEVFMEHVCDFVLTAFVPNAETFLPISRLTFYGCERPILNNILQRENGNWEVCKSGSRLRYCPAKEEFCVNIYNNMSSCNVDSIKEIPGHDMNEDVKLSLRVYPYVVNNIIRNSVYLDEERHKLILKSRSYFKFDKLVTEREKFDFMLYDLYGIDWPVPITIGQTENGERADFKLNPKDATYDLKGILYEGDSIIAGITGPLEESPIVSTDIMNHILSLAANRR